MPREHRFRPRLPLPRSPPDLTVSRWNLDGDVHEAAADTGRAGPDRQDTVAARETGAVSSGGHGAIARLDNTEGPGRHFGGKTSMLGTRKSLP